MPPLLSVALITLNEEANLPRTLASIRWADEIIVVDAGSTDRTVAIAQDFGAIVLHHPWQGFAAQKNLAISHCTGTWILSLDADEELSPELQHEIRSLLPTDPPIDAFALRRRNLFLGRWMRHGGFYPDVKLRLFRRATASTFEPRPVHETIRFHGPQQTLTHDLIHHAYPTLHAYIEHMNRYSSLGADLVVAKGHTGRSLAAFFLNVLYIPQFNFFWNYVVRLGFLDGREGLLQHTYGAVYTSWKYAKAWEQTRHLPAMPPSKLPLPLADSHLADSHLATEQDHQATRPTP